MSHWSDRLLSGGRPNGPRRGLRAVAALSLVLSLLLAAFAVGDGPAMVGAQEGGVYDELTEPAGSVYGSTEPAGGVYGTTEPTGDEVVPDEQVVEAPAPAPDPNDPFANVVLPGGMGEVDMKVYVKATGHTIRNTMLDYWRATGAASVYGNPISEPFASADGYYSQAFENAIFKFLPEYLYSEDPSVRLMGIGDDALRDRVGGLRRDGRRDGGGGDRRGSVWRPLNPNGQTVESTLSDGGTFDEESRHTISGAFLRWYDAHEGFFYLGNPLSEPVAERGETVQYFDGGLLLRDDDGNVRLAPLAAEMADRLGIDTKRVKQNGLPLFDESLFWTAPNPYGDADPDAPGMKRIEVSIGEQTLRAYQGDELVLETYVSTGLAPNLTETGLFHVRYKLEKEDMRGFTSATGEVVGLGDGSGQQSGISYSVNDVPHVMYINNDAEALHGAYWHSNFGYQMSHGCINQPLDVAAFMFGWAPLGTQVWVHE